MSVDAEESELQYVTNFRKCLLDSLIYYPPELSEQHEVLLFGSI